MSSPLLTVFQLARRLHQTGNAPSWKGAAETVAEMPGKIWDTAKSGITAPGDALSGKMPVFGSDGHVTDEAVERAADLAGIAGLSSAPLPRQGTLGSFGGIFAKTADKRALSKAMKMEGQGGDRNSIWQD